LEKKMALIQVRGIRRSFARSPLGGESEVTPSAEGSSPAASNGSGSTEVLRGISLEIQAGEFVSVMGPSGSGKSTLLQIIGGLDRPTSGDVLIEDRSLAAMDDDALSLFRRRRLGFIFQFFNLMPTLSALENVALPLLLDGKPFEAIRPEALELLGTLGVAHRANHRPHQLSGGEMQRVAICRALITRPPLILADEPTGNLDTRTGAQVLEILRQVVHGRGQTLMMVTHDPKAAQAGTRLIRIRDGGIESDERLAPT
jgi:putative ABC transport system ATP-binding protein